MEGKQLQENSELLNVLFNKIKLKHKLSTGTNKELENVKEKWYQAKLIQLAVKDFCNECDQLSDENVPSEVPTEGGSLSQRCLLTECEQLIKCSCSRTQAHLLGIQSPEMLPPPTEDCCARYKRKVKAQIHKKLLAISQFYQPGVASAGTNLANAKAAQLQHIISKDKAAIMANQAAEEQLLEKRVEVLHKLQQVHQKNLKLFYDLLEKYCVTVLPEENIQTTQHLSAKTEALAAKIELIEKELCADTYTPELVRELSKIRLVIDRKLAEAHENLNKAERDYHACLSAGTEFQRMAKEYAELKKDIEARAWALNELKAAKSHKSLY